MLSDVRLIIYIIDYSTGMSSIIIAGTGSLGYIAIKQKFVENPLVPLSKHNGVIQCKKKFQIVFHTVGYRII